jgi:hypothetical protein
MKRQGALVAAGLAAATVVASAQTLGVPERFTALAVNLSNGGSGMVELVVNRWSSDAEREKLVTTLMERGPEHLLDVLEDMPRMGYIRLDGGLGYDLHYAHRVEGDDGGHRVVLATNRPIGFWEASTRPRSIDYPFTVIELRLNADGEGEGKLSFATKITADAESRVVTLENYDTQPVLLQSVRSARVSQ